MKVRFITGASLGHENGCRGRPVAWARHPRPLTLIVDLGHRQHPQRTGVFNRYCYPIFAYTFCHINAYKIFLYTMLSPLLHYSLGKSLDVG